MAGVLTHPKIPRLYIVGETSRDSLNQPYENRLVSHHSLAIAAMRNERESDHHILRSYVIAARVRTPVSVHSVAPAALGSIERIIGTSQKAFHIVTRFGEGDTQGRGYSI